MSYSDAIILMTKDSRVNLSLRDATLCYGLSKMTVGNEMVKGVNPYKRLTYVEFLEYIGRVAYEKYKEDSTSPPLYIKIERLLDDLLYLVNHSRREIQRRVEFNMDDSDESVDEEVRRVKHKVTVSYQKALEERFRTNKES